MSIQDELDALRQKVPGCELSAYGDISSGLILRSSSAHHHPREMLDRLCEEADACCRFLEEANEILSQNGQFVKQQALLFSAKDSRVFARHRSEQEIVCSLIEPGSDISVALESTAAAAAVLSEEGT